MQFSLDAFNEGAKIERKLNGFLTRRIVKYCNNPNIFTILSFIFAIVSGILFYFNIYLFAGIFCELSLYGDIADGAIAKNYNLRSKFGSFLDHSLDRISDFIIFIGMYFSKYDFKDLLFIAFALISLVSYIGIQAEISIGKRNRGGILGRGRRMNLIFLAAVLTLWGNIQYIFSILMYVFIFGSAISILQRFINIYLNVSKTPYAK